MINQVFFLLKRIRDFLLVKIVWNRHQIGKNFHAGARVRLWGKNKLVIGRNFYIGRDAQIDCDALVGDNVMLANRVALVGRYDHNYQQIGIPIRLASRIRDSDYNWKGLNLKVIIEDDVWVGYGSIILSGVKIGQGSIIAAGSVVTNNVDPFSIYAGIPAKKIRNRFNSEAETEEHIKLYNINFKKSVK
ncbi:MAG: acyltransferase [Bacteroidales bacterium]